MAHSDSAEVPELSHLTHHHELSQGGDLARLDLSGGTSRFFSEFPLLPNGTAIRGDHHGRHFFRALIKVIHRSITTVTLSRCTSAPMTPVFFALAGGLSLGSSSKVSYFLDGTPVYLGMWFCAPTTTTTHR